MIVRYAISNMPPSSLAHMAQDYGLSGSVWDGYGFGQWGIEPTTFVEVATNDPLGPVAADAFIRSVLFKTQEKCAYRTIDGSNPVLLHMDGRLEAV